MRPLSDFPRLHLPVLPTPLCFLPRLFRRFGIARYLKCDGMTGLSLGNSKVRRRGFLFADALQKP